ncbi:FAD-dependent oxidoreductase [Streptomyces canus]|uniref:FAD-dependent oxidoreductase n=1 Tax=Streptomyces canus TaxID=58343 RepID=UPI0036B7C9E6
MKRIVVVGGSVAAVTTAQSLRVEGYDGQVTALSEESHPPYSRVPLSKGVLAGRDSVESALLPLPSEDIEFRTGLATTADGTDRRYDGLVIATGTGAHRLTGDNDLVVRSLNDASTLAARPAAAHSAIVLGDGFLGMEVAGTCRALRLEATVIDLVPPLLRLLGPWPAELAVAAARDHGIRIRVAPDGLEVLDEHRVRCGESVLTADVIVCAAGDVPNTDWLCCRVAPGAVAAGDVVSSLPHGESARPYRHDPNFRTGQSGLNIKISGELPLTGTPEVPAGWVDGRSALLRWRHDAGTAASVAVTHRLPVIKLKRLGAGVTSAVPARTTRLTQGRDHDLPAFRPLRSARPRPPRRSRGPGRPARQSERVSA